MTTQRDYYEILEITRTATVEEVKKSFRAKARQYHPDVNKEDGAEAMFKELGEAYEVLSDPQKRQVYDAYGHEGLRGGGYQPSWDFMQGFPDLNDLFAQFFGGGFSGDSGFGGRGSQGGSAKGEDLRMDVELDFMDAAFGVQKELEIKHLSACEPCEGSGSAADSDGPAVCQTCGGQGQIRQTTQTIIGHFTQISTCPRCQGQGTMIVNPCKNCKGRGRVEDSKTLSLSVPAGVDSGTRLRITGEGNVGPQGGPAGDLYVILHVKSHSVFQREGYELFAAVPVTYSQLALGDEIEVPLLKGIDKIKVPAGTQSGSVFTLKHKGLQVLNAPNQHGNYHVKFVLDVPKKLPAEERKLLEKLKQLEADRLAQEEKAPHASFMHKMKEVLSGGGG